MDTNLQQVLFWGLQFVKCVTNLLLGRKVCTAPVSELFFFFFFRTYFNSQPCCLYSVMQFELIVANTGCG